MNYPTDANPEAFLDPQQVVPTATAPTRPMYWSVRRELWETRSIYLAPLAVAALFLIGFMISTIQLPGRVRAAMLLAPMQQYEVLQRHYTVAGLLIMAAGFIVSVFYCLEALHSDRRDRSILFWKSLPVSDLTTVLAKASIPLLVIPLLSFAIAVVTQTIMLLLSSVVLMGNAGSVAMLWNRVPLFQMSILLLYHLIAIHALWYAPIYGWLLLVSAWARRLAFLWAGLPLLAIAVVEKVAFNTSRFASLLGYRINGDVAGMGPTVCVTSKDWLAQITPGQLLSSPGLWIGLALTAAFLAGAVRLRRYQGPI